MRPLTPYRCVCLLMLCSGIALLPGCGGSSSKPSVVTPPTTPTPGAAIAGCKIKQINALKPPCPPGVNCVTASCTANSLSCSSLSQGNWNEFSQFILGSKSIYGVNIYVPWASVDTGSPGAANEYDFTAIDAQVSYYTTTYPSKKVNLMWMAINYGNINNSAGGVNGMTPAYVFTTSYASSLNPPAAPQDVAYCSNYPGNGTFVNTTANASVGATFDSTGYPVTYEAPFTTAYENFIQAVLNHYKGNSTIGYMRFGLSVGDEADAYCTAQMQALPPPNTFESPTTWEDYVSTIDGFESSQNPSMLLMESLNVLDTTPDPTTLPAFEAQTAVSNNFGFGSNGWQQSDISDIANNNLTACTADWCELFSTFHTDSITVNGASMPVPLELQTAVPSDDTASNAVGNLATLISQSAAVEFATILELSQDDLYLALESGYMPPDGNASDATSYASAISAPCNVPAN
jgi:hypothetical protein